jgi:hypothetical protein
MINLARTGNAVERFPVSGFLFPVDQFGWRQRTCASHPGFVRQFQMLPLGNDSPSPTANLEGAAPSAPHHDAASQVLPAAHGA